MPLKNSCMGHSLPPACNVSSGYVNDGPLAFLDVGQKTPSQIFFGFLSEFPQRRPPNTQTNTPVCRYPDAGPASAAASHSFSRSPAIAPALCKHTQQRAIVLMSWSDRLCKIKIFFNWSSYYQTGCSSVPSRPSVLPLHPGIFFLGTLREHLGTTESGFLDF